MVMVFCAMVAVPIAGYGATTKFAFWSSGYSLDMQEWAKTEVFPKFEKAHNVTIEYSEIGWGAGREEKLLTALAANIMPDVFMNANWQYGIALDSLIAKWSDARMIDPALWKAVRDRRYKETYYVPQVVEVRGFAYNKRLFLEAGLEPQPPQSWDELLVVAKRLTKLQGSKVEQSGFETVWSAPFVGSEFDWFLQQAGKQVTADDLMTSTIRSPEGLDALKMLVGLYGITHPAGYAALSEGAFPAGKVAITRGHQSALVNMLSSNPDDAKNVDVYAPRRYPDGKGAAIAFTNGLGISKQAKDVSLAWEFIKFMLNTEIQTSMAPVTNTLVVRRDVATNTRMEAIRKFLPWYNIMQNVTIPGFFQGRSDAATHLVEALQGKRSPENALEMMHQAQQVALDKFWQD